MFTASYDDWHFLAFYIQTVDDRDEGLTINHYFENPPPGQFVRESTEYLAKLGKISGQVILEDLRRDLKYC